ncbi:hypothetical protein, partial [Micromonospora sp. NPDC005172]|uniref:hypothetical protein n=1 Tax=Micromonospora sp. NPDC005172 TaxID=3156867 RepID=UPI0033B6C2A9
HDRRAECSDSGQGSIERDAAFLGQVGHLAPSKPDTQIGRYWREDKANVQSECWVRSYLALADDRDPPGRRRSPTIEATLTTASSIS